MSIVCWDGKTLVTDRQATVAGHKFAVTKSKQLSDGTILAWTGEHGKGLILAQWYEAGAKAEKWPEFQNENDWCRLIVVTPNGEVFDYEQQPVAMKVEEPVFAFGAGRDFALGALAMGATAREAVEIVCRLSDSCGCGIDEYHVNFKQGGLELCSSTTK